MNQLDHHDLPQGIIDIDIDSILFNSNNKQESSIQLNKNTLFSIKDANKINFKHQNRLTLAKDKLKLSQNSTNNNSEYELVPTQSTEKELILYFNPKSKSYTLTKENYSFQIVNIKNNSPPPPPTLQPVYTSDNDEFDNDLVNIPNSSPSLPQPPSLHSSSPLPPPRTNMQSSSSPLPQPPLSSSPLPIGHNNHVDSMIDQNGYSSDPVLDTNPSIQPLPDIQYDDDDEDEFEMVPSGNAPLPLMDQFYEEGDDDQDSFDAIPPYTTFNTNDSSPRHSTDLIPVGYDDQSSDRRLSFDAERSPTRDQSSTIINVLDTSGMMPSSPPTQNYGMETTLSSMSDGMGNDSPPSSSSQMHPMQQRHDAGHPTTTSIQVNQMFSSDD